MSKFDYPVNEKSLEEGFKLQYDFYKHLTTLSTASILLLVTFIEKIFPQPKWKMLVGVSFILLLISILASLVCMMTIAGFVINKNAVKQSYYHFYSIVACIATFLGGITSLIIFTMLNFLSDI